MDKNNEEKVNIALTKSEYLALLKAVYLGNWIANANRDGSNEDPHYQEYEDISDRVFSLAPLFGFDKYVSHELENGTRYYPTDIFEKETNVHDLHDEYDEETFWDELCDRLGTRDFYRKYTKEEVQEMTDEEHFLKLQECIIVYEEETAEHGIERLHTLKTPKELGF